MQQVITKEKLKKAHQLAGYIRKQKPELMVTDALLQKAKKALFDFERSEKQGSARRAGSYFDIEKFVSKKGVSVWR